VKYAKNVKLVLDTNVIVSAIRFGGVPRVLWERCLKDKSIVLLTSPATISEISEVFTRKFDWAGSQVTELCQLLQQNSLMVHPSVPLRVVRDPNDDMFVELAVAANADYIISGDKDLLELGDYNGIKIMSVVSFMRELG